MMNFIWRKNGKFVIDYTISMETNRKFSISKKLFTAKKMVTYSCPKFIYFLWQKNDKFSMAKI